MARAKDGLTDRQDKFCSFYVKYTNGTKAAIKAGYKKKTAYSMANRLLKNVEILKVINSRLRRVKSRATADKQEVLEFMTKDMRGKTKDHVVGVDVTGASYDFTKPPDTKDRLKAAEDLLKEMNDKVVNRLKIKRAVADVEKVRAEAEIKKYDAKQDNSAQNKTINQTTKILQKLENAGKDK